MSAAKLAKERPAGQIYITIVGRIQRSVPGGSVIHAASRSCPGFAGVRSKQRTAEVRNVENQSSKRRRDENIEE